MRAVRPPADPAARLARRDALGSLESLAAARWRCPCGWPRRGGRRVARRHLRASAEVMAALLPASGLPSGVPATNGDTRFAWQVVDRHPARGDAICRVHRASPFCARADAATSRQRSSARLWPARSAGRARIRARCARLPPSVEAKFEVAVSAGAGGAGRGHPRLLLAQLRCTLRHELAPVQRAVGIDWPGYARALAPGATLGAAERAELETATDRSDRSRPAAGATLAHERAFTAQAAHALRTRWLASTRSWRCACARARPSCGRACSVREAAAGRLATRGAGTSRRCFAATASRCARRSIWGCCCDSFRSERLEVDLAGDPSARRRSRLARRRSATCSTTRSATARRVSRSHALAATLRLDDDGPGVTAERRAALCAALSIRRPTTGVSGLGLHAGLTWWPVRMAAPALAGAGRRSRLLGRVVVGTLPAESATARAVARARMSRGQRASRRDSRNTNSRSSSSAAHARCTDCGPPAPRARLRSRGVASEEPEVGDALEALEVAEHRSERRVDDRKVFAAEVRAPRRARPPAWRIVAPASVAATAQQPPGRARCRTPRCRWSTAEPNSIQARWRARCSGSRGCRRGASACRRGIQRSRADSEDRRDAHQQHRRLCPVAARSR